MKRVSSLTLLMKHVLVITETPTSLVYSTIIKISILPSYPKSKKATCLGFFTYDIKLALRSVAYLKNLTPSTS